MSKPEISSFRGCYAFLSNFYPSPVEYEGDVYPTVENAYQAAKLLRRELRAPFLHCTARQSKRMGRALGIRADWLSVREEIMHGLLLKKFYNPRLVRLLLRTGDAPIVEGNDWGDTFWGRCDGVGCNKLGVMLMEIRATLKKVPRPRKIPKRAEALQRRREELAELERKYQERLHERRLERRSR